MVAKWYALHDIGSVRAHSQRAKFQGANEEPFMTTDDERLTWLEVDFIAYLEELQRSGCKSRNRMTKETYEATVLTTRSTVALIEYLLDHVNFRYVLTRGLNSDPVESLFSCFRQYNGGNDRVDARAAVFTAEKLLKVGILQAAKNGNAPISSEANASIKVDVKKEGPVPMPSGLVLAARELSSEMEYLSSWSDTRADIELAPVAYLAGYLVRVCEEKVATRGPYRISSSPSTECCNNAVRHAIRAAAPDWVARPGVRRFRQESEGRIVSVKGSGGFKLRAGGAVTRDEEAPAAAPDRRKYGALWRDRN
ncbi:hypothetical protein HPB50_011070 [Hyalomma asiaticum]|uniref:Uncharacterized protein n=1 Tax=Hyalomma asiaticum TaxID=266040 RepID=A0ACB7S908_HYAAI|nr:hypothetical protein HPB50_011070 [Hyalomma asiaticum]